MKASEYLAIKYRMCIRYCFMGTRTECAGCPFRELRPFHKACVDVERDHPDKALAIVKQWAAENPDRRSL